jgi:hypothetical protein
VNIRNKAKALFIINNKITTTEKGMSRKATVGPKFESQFESAKSGKQKRR